ncbi:adhesin [Acinetobacter guerrae]|uniref:Adhesin n=2 Tax=Acinetobacter guerrae TaxID=1843371 RepID=A0A3A8EW52_9GAMM|nr:adhesin [Acinetobacter guerrae]
MGLSLLGFEAQANYSPIIINPSDGYTISLDSNTPVATTSVIGSDGQNYYQVGEAIDIRDTSKSVSVSGKVKCLGNTWGTGSNWNIPDVDAYHYLYMYVPKAGVAINGVPAYRINSNVVMTLKADLTNYWINKTGRICSDIAENSPNTTEDVKYFTVQFPIIVTFYLNEKIIDGQIVINGLDLGGYLRAFMNPSKRPILAKSIPIDQTTAPMRLKASQLNLVSSCSTETNSGSGGTGTGTLNLNHGMLSSTSYDSRVSGHVNYNCTFSKSTPVKLRLDYVKDDDPQKRLPLKNTLIGSTDKIYSELILRDEITGEAGTEIQTIIEKSKTITITSHIQGNSAVAGDYQGSAWLIATFD